MQKLSLTTLLTFFSFLTFAQLKSVDFEAYIIPLDTIVEYGETLSFEFGFINNGPEAIEVTDTFIFVLPHLGPDNWDNMISIYATIPVGDTFISDAEVYFDYENRWEEDTMMAFCIEVRGLEGITNQGRPMVPTFEDPNPDNNVFCAEPVLLKGKGESASIAQNERTMELVIYPNPVQDRLWVQFDHAVAPEARFELITVDGRVLHKDRLSEIRHQGLDVSAFSSGVYFIKIWDQEVAYVQKFKKR